jgi:Spy/CpxP family protein refolding chaperone
MLAAIFAAFVCGSLASNVRADVVGEESGMGEGSHPEMNWSNQKAKLGLSDDQVSKLNDAQKSNLETLKPLHQNVQNDMKKLQEQVDSKASDSDIQSTLDDIQKNRKDMTSQMEKHHDEVTSILNPTQRAKFMLEMQGKMKGMQGMHGGKGWKKGKAGGQ